MGIKVKLTDYKLLGKIGNAVYHITCPLSKSGRGIIGYAGKTSGSTRFRSYCNLECPKQPKLLASLEKYGPENHYLEILQEVPTAQGLIGLEKLYIKMYDTFNNGLNCTLGG